MKNGHRNSCNDLERDLFHLLHMKTYFFHRTNHSVHSNGQDASLHHSTIFFPITKIQTTKCGSDSDCLPGWKTINFLPVWQTVANNWRFIGSTVYRGTSLPSYHEGIPSRRTLLGLVTPQYRRGTPYRDDWGNLDVKDQGAIVHVHSQPYHDSPHP